MSNGIVVAQAIIFLLVGYVSTTSAFRTLRSNHPRNEKSDVSCRKSSSPLVQLYLRPDSANDQFRETMWRSSQLNFRSDEDSTYETLRSDLQVTDDAISARGWSLLSETLNGRLASAGLIIGLFREEISGHSLLQQLQDDEFPLVFVASVVSLLTVINYSSWVQRRVRQQNLPLL